MAGVSDEIKAEITKNTEDLSFILARAAEIHAYKNQAIKKPGNVLKLTQILEFIAYQIDNTSVDPKILDQKEVPNYDKLQEKIKELANEADPMNRKALSKICCSTALSICHEKKRCYFIHP